MSIAMWLLINFVMDNIAVILCVIIIILFIWTLTPHRSSNLPPGPGPSLPLVGHLYLLDRDPRKKFSTWKRKYGDMFSLYIGKQLLIILNSYDVIKEAFVHFGEVMSDRPLTFVSDKMWEGKGK